jgi:hypothetical protein
MATALNASWPIWSCPVPRDRRPPRVAGREQRGRRGVQRQVRARCRGQVPLAGYPEIQHSGHRGRQRAGQADADEPERAVDQIRQAAGPGPGEDVEDQRRYERSDRQRDQHGMARMTVGTGQQRTVHPAWIPRQQAPVRRAAACFHVRTAAAFRLRGIAPAARPATHSAAGSSAPYWLPSRARGPAMGSGRGGWHLSP